MQCHIKTLIAALNDIKKLYPDAEVYNLAPGKVTLLHKNGRILKEITLPTAIPKYAPIPFMVVKQNA